MRSFLVLLDDSAPLISGSSGPAIVTDSIEVTGELDEEIALGILTAG